MVDRQFSFSILECNDCKINKCNPWQVWNISMSIKRVGKWNSFVLTSNSSVEAMRFLTIEMVHPHPIIFMIEILNWVKSMRHILTKSNGKLIFLLRNVSVQKSANNEEKNVLLNQNWPHIEKYLFFSLALRIELFSLFSAWKKIYWSRRFHFKIIRKRHDKNFEIHLDSYKFHLNGNIVQDAQWTKCIKNKFTRKKKKKWKFPTNKKKEFARKSFQIKLSKHRQSRRKKKKKTRMFCGEACIQSC